METFCDQVGVIARPTSTSQHVATVRMILGPFSARPSSVELIDQKPATRR
ncbi:hypothetical protein HMPREF9582_01179 [Cutibacterium acnes HL060PA1]|nr:hypothetical protein HMPREF9603_01237 [Cutibacterium acnes HL001PA1]EFT10821.1 hypothetical protein HMPREF9619_00677 [Cutibacterium acnes HL082PA2]EFT25146.1 hypothetical protein HMPREF9577_02009 [Cutibacterium acnes HL110PA3]EFT63856.1 hypothetical protein HMPREF9578_00239 [Cutibacterium acnes HL110PA4]EFT65337.1 hypothetical protein HMPREF9582_01179 [Cutibacterium acnes HL060PA1]EFT75359.1 hypothetical protein HMPREF9599_00955 [Cutibacterium acnes HL050PA2]EGE69324.1 hypothetical protein